MSAPVSGDVFRRVFRHHASGVAVVTSSGESPAGFTATSVVSLSADPPLLSFGLSCTASSWPAFAVAEHVAVHLLTEEQQELAATFARSGIDRFAAPTGWRPGPYGVPVLDDVLALLVCEVVDRVSTGDHTLVIAEPKHTEYREDGRPLLYHDGQFQTLSR
ncbi:flavin reductase family protein [Kitasatospora sp. NPDC056184]|uniref:flavin reductase family protein n=1 Tax=Kitasatospora sp. NPDC056184 TaxID=3345738 RepID=UPI0035E2A6E8